MGHHSGWAGMQMELAASCGRRLVGLGFEEQLDAPAATGLLVAECPYLRRHRRSSRPGLRSLLDLCVHAHHHTATFHISVTWLEANRFRTYVLVPP